ncbi:MAG TPA: CocE/NonD family hydrolase [Gemmatimonadaceae bacterium]|nr:CocE/NonD family hydrolase [Gemmatimonadaceae bacterium]
MRLALRAVPLLICATASLATARAQGTPTPDPAFTFTEAMVATRDGVRLHTVIFTPKVQSGTLPILVVRTPYGVPGPNFPISRAWKEFVDEGFIFAFQDIRGRYGSEGTFVMQRPPRPVDAGAKAFDESTDAYDMMEWLITNVPGNNGRIGMLGVSYPGWTTAMAMLDPHPALKAVSPQASPADMFLGDDFHHNGAFRLSYGFEYAFLTEASKENSNFTFDRYDTYEWYLALGPLSTVQTKYLKERKLPTWDDFRLHPDYDAFWQRQAMKPYLRRVTVPTLNVAGWWDQEDFYGPLLIYRELEKHDAKSNNFLVVGPWRHGSWSGGPGQKLGNIDFGSPTGEHFRAKIEVPFFAFHLKDKGSLVQPEATVFEAGSNRWRTFDAWPPREATTRSLHFHANGRLSFEPPPAGGSTPGDGGGFDSYVSDPAKPVPYRRRPIEPTYYEKGSGWPVWLLEDQRFVADRPDVLSWETAPLAEDVVVAGDITAKLFASTTGQDADFVVKLIDVYPEDYPPDYKLGGYQLMVANDVFRARFRNSFEKPEPMVPGRVTPVTIDLHTQSYRFQKGHKIQVQVQSTWFPIIDRNPQTWVPNIFEARATDYKAQTHRIWRTPAAASRVEISTVTP